LATKLIPLADKIVIKPVVQEEVLASGIVIPDTAKEKPQQGEIVAAGPGRLDDDGKRIPMDLKVGDRVLYAKYSGQEIKIDQTEYIVLSEKDVLCKVQIVHAHNMPGVMFETSQDRGKKKQPKK